MVGLKIHGQPVSVFLCPVGVCSVCLEQSRNRLQSNEKQTTPTTQKTIAKILFCSYRNMKTKRKKQMNFAYIIRYRKKLQKISKKIWKFIFFVVSLHTETTKTSNTMKLTNRISIFVPSTYEGNKPAKRLQKKAVKHTAKYLCKYFGGSTAQAAQGFWQSDTLGLVEEKQIIVFAQCSDTDLQAHKESVFNIAKAICKYMKQEAVTVTVNNEMFFVEA